MKKKINKKRILVIILLLILIPIGYFIVDLLKSNDEYKNIKIIAIKKITENEQTQKITYTIKIKDYNIESTTKEIKFETKEQAQLEYERYQIINEYENKGWNLQIKNKKITLIMTEEQFKEDIEYDKQNSITYMNTGGEQKEIISQEELTQTLTEQGYTIK